MNTEDKTPPATIEVLGSLFVPIVIEVPVTRDDLIESGADFRNMHELTCWLEDIALDRAHDCQPTIPQTMECLGQQTIDLIGDRVYLEIADIGSSQGLDKLAEACADLITTEEEA